MKTHRLFAMLLALALLCATAASAEGILPVLQTPPPEITETISYHRAMNFSSTPSADTNSEGGYTYTYSYVTYPEYLDFGRALAQEGFTLSGSGVTDRGVTRAVVTNGAELTVEYNTFQQELTVIYPPRVLAWEADEENPYVIDAALEPALPRLPEVISFHRAMNYSNAPSGDYNSEGRFYYDYSYVGYAGYQEFGQALAQEGFALTSGEVNESGVVQAELSDGKTDLSLTYDPFFHTLRVAYPFGTLAAEVDPENRYVVDAAQASPLPEIRQTISMHAVTGLTFSTPERVEGGYRYGYSSVPYECYAQFSVKLGEEGFTLVSSETTEEGYNRAVVTDGTVELVLDYDQENKRAYVTYPAGFSPRDAILFDDFTPLEKGQTIDLQESLALTVTGWQAVDYYCDYYYSENWIPSKYYGHDHYTGDGVQQVLVCFEIDDRRPEELSVLYILNNLMVYVDGKSVDINYGRYTEGSGIYQDSDSTATVNDVFTFGVGFQLTEAQAAHPENVVVTFADKNKAVPYAYRLEP